MKDLSVLIPANNEMFLKNTVEDILSNIEADTEIIVVLDGKWADPAIPQHDRVNIIYLPESIGQRAATNVACRLSKAKYVMKVDAHCSFDKGFDRKLIEDMQDDWTVVPVMRNLHAFDWKCYRCGWKKYQGPTPKRCEGCNDSRYIRRKLIWQPRRGIHSTSYSFDSEPHFQYFEDYKHRPEYIKDKAEKGLTESMSLQGSCFMCTREKYWELNLCDESLGSWGNQGLEVACKTWLSGGKVMVNHKTWYAHMFRTQGGDFSFPYEQRQSDIEKTKQKTWDFFFSKWDKQKYPVSWLIEKFWPIPQLKFPDGAIRSKGWTKEDLDKLKDMV